MTHICVGKLTIIGSDNGLAPERRQAIIWTNAGILLIGPLGTNFSEILIEIQTFSLKKIRLKMSLKCCSFHLGLNVLTQESEEVIINVSVNDTPSTSNFTRVIHLWRFINYNFTNKMVFGCWNGCLALTQYQNQYWQKPRGFSKRLVGRLRGTPPLFCQHAVEFSPLFLDGHFS